MWIRLALNDLFFVLDEPMAEKTLEANVAEVGPLTKQDPGDYLMNTLRTRLASGHDAWIIGHRALPDPIRHTIDPFGSVGRHWIHAPAVYYLAVLPG